VSRIWAHSSLQPHKIYTSSAPTDPVFAPISVKPGDITRIRPTYFSYLRGEISRVSLTELCEKRDHCSEIRKVINADFIIKAVALRLTVVKNTTMRLGKTPAI
jgi:hypothetical protein